MNVGRKKILILLTSVTFVWVLGRVLVSLIQEEGNKFLSSATPLIISVYYEALCPDSKNFILRQLLPTFENTHNALDIILIPYGKATTIPTANGSYNFSCQHGEVECMANIVHACTIENISDLRSRLNVIGCMINDNRDPKRALFKCMEQNNVDNLKAVLDCSEGKKGRELLKVHGAATMSLRPAITFIPTVTIDGNQGNQASILKNLYLEVCKAINDPEDKLHAKCEL